MGNIGKNFIMDVNYILSREQISLHNSLNSPSMSARIAHAAFAKAYGKLLKESPFPHREPVQLNFRRAPSND